MSDREVENDAKTEKSNQTTDESEQQPNEMAEQAPNYLAIGELPAVILQLRNEIAASQKMQAKSIDQLKKGQDNINAKLEEIQTNHSKEIAAVEKEMHEVTENLKQLKVKISKDEIPPKIFKLDVDCMQEVFDYLSIKDIHSVAQTWPRMKRIAGDYFQTNFRALEMEYIRDGFHTLYGGIILNELMEFAQRLTTNHQTNATEEAYRFIGASCKSLKQLDLHVSNAIEIQQLKPILSKIETIGIQYYNREFYETFLKFCPKLKELCLHGLGYIIIGTSNEWLLRSYPTLEHLSFNVILEIPELATFFERNPNLQELTINCDGLSANINLMLQSKIKLQVLEIGYIYEDELQTMCSHLKQLYNQGFYRRLHLYGYFPNQQSIDQISSLNCFGLETFISSVITPALNSLTNLKEMSLKCYKMDSPDFLVDSQSIAKNLVNLERLHFEYIESEILHVFIEHSMKLKVITIKHFIRTESINLCQLNKKREKLLDAKKLTIYLEEGAYLSTKWSNTSNDFKMIEVKRIEAYDGQIPEII